MTHMGALIVSGKEAIKVLVKNGFTVKGQKGSHVHLIKTAGSETLHVTVPVHENKDLNPFVLRSIARQAGYNFEEFAKLF